MNPELTLAEFTLLTRRAGLALTEAQLAAIYPAHGYVLAMAQRVRTPRGREAEPAHVFAFAPEVLP
jgi:hypothetical protein